MKQPIAIFEALADENRLRVLNLLIVSPELCVADLERILGLPQTRVSRHLAYLKSRDLVDARRNGTWKYYTLGTVFRQQPNLAGTLRSMLIQSEQCLSDIELLLEGLDRNSVTALQGASSETIESVIQNCCAA
jgi:ArsR family transcriptional regulator, arsenate/arsenite/antimonite-responsive transcriptional repressor